MTTWGKRSISLLLVLCMVFSFAACAGSSAKSDANGTSTAADGKVIVDIQGREVVVPKDTKNNTVASTYGVLTTYFVTLRVSDRVVGANFKNKAFLRMADEKIAAVGSVGKNTIDQEALAAANPDVYICKKDEPEKLDIAKSLNIPLLTMDAETPEAVMFTYTMLGEALGVEDRAKEINDYLSSNLENVKALAAKIPEADKKTSLVMGTEIGRVAGDDMLQTYLLELVGSKPVVKGYHKDLIWINLGAEKVLELNPEYIFVTSSGALDYTIEDLKTDTAFSAMQAVKNDHVYRIPAVKDSWDVPGPAFIMAAYFMLSKMHPELLSDAELQEKIDEYYTVLYGKTFTGEEIGY